jgi:hypothetical protein
MGIAARQRFGAVLRAKHVAEYVELASRGGVSQGECAKKRLQREEPGRDKRDRNAPRPVPEYRQLPSPLLPLRNTVRRHSKMPKRGCGNLLMRPVCNPQDLLHSIAFRRGSAPGRRSN